MERSPWNGIFKRGRLSRQIRRGFKNNYFGFSERENSVMRTWDAHILESLGELNLAESYPLANAFD